MSSTSRDALPPVGADFVRGNRFIGTSAEARELREQVRIVAATDSTVLIRGETGTGKGLVATLIHHSSTRRHQPFVHLDCTSIAPSLVESELFGHERGAFTGAASRRIGRFEQAAKGTIFLDEVGDMEPSLQVKLLRVLQDRRLERIGGTNTIAVSARVLAATNRDLEQAVREQRFRTDLYYRLNVLELHIPPLRARKEDLEPLARARIGELERLCERPVSHISPGFYSTLRDYDWPGNVRELDNFLQRAVLLGEGRPLDHRLAARLMASGAGGATAPVRTPAPGRAKDHPAGTRSEGDEILAVLRASGWNVALAARSLRVPRSTLRYRIARLGLHGRSAAAKRGAEVAEGPNIPAPYGVDGRARVPQSVGMSSMSPATSPELEAAIGRAQALIASANRIVVLTGAGISTDSGIPDFRGPKGVWTRDPQAEKMSTLQNYMADKQLRKRSWQIKSQGAAQERKPNRGHIALLELERHRKLHTLITQNVDGLHSDAGTSSELIVEIHGTLREVVCMRCDDRAPMHTALERVRAGEDDPACSRCGGILKSATISFGQGLVAEDLARSEHAAQTCDLILAIGTTLAVFPIAAVVPVAKEAGARVIILNAEATEMDALADVVLHGQIGEILPRVVSNP